MTDLAGAVVLVLGASGGLGSRIAALLEDEDAIVVRAARNPDTLSGADAYLADIGETTGPASLVAAALAAHGRIDGVVIAAGVVAFGTAADTSDGVVDELFATNTIGPIRLIRDAIGPLTESASSGRSPFLVTISGVVAETPTAGLAAYSASKAALAAFVRASTREYRRAGIRLLDARPGHTATELSTHPIEGTAPSFGAALDAGFVAERIVRAIVDDEKDLPSSAFA